MSIWLLCSKLWTGFEDLSARSINNAASQRQPPRHRRANCFT
jgi:hypothetical protein